MATILLTGANGQLGNEIQKWHQADPFEGRNRLIVTDVGELDVTDFAAVGSVVTMQKVDVIVNCAAYTAVDRAESEPEAALRINAVGPEVLARAARAYDASLVHISTDYVFDGRSEKSYREDDPTAPLGVYGHTKLEGEQAVLRSGCNGVILRTSWLYSSFGNNFVKTMMRLGRERDELRVVADQWGSPTYAADLADFIMRKAVPALVGMPRRAEVYHYSNQGETSWCGFAAKIMELAGIECRVAPIPTSEYPTPAARPHYSLLDKSKIIRDFNITIPAWEESLAKCIKLLK